MFAIALWDSRRKRLVLARDPIGKKPLFYSWDGRRLLFGSEIKAILAGPGVSREMDPTAVSDYFTYQYVPAPKTIYRDVRKLRAGHYLIAEASGMREVCYWDIRFDQTRELSESEWCEQFLEEFRTAVKLRLVSDVPLGAFLSGGVDSSSVVALMNSFQSPVTTCSIGFTRGKLRRGWRGSTVRGRAWARTTSSRSWSRTPSISYPNLLGTMMSRSRIPRPYRPTTFPRWRASM